MAHLEEAHVEAKTFEIYFSFDKIALFYLSYCDYVGIHMCYLLDGRD